MVLATIETSVGYQKEVSLSWDPEKAPWEEENQPREYVTIKQKKEMPKHFNTTVEVSAHNIKNVALHILNLIE